MAISNVAASFRPGICTSTTRPINPFLGMLIFETDTFAMNFWNGSAWQGAISAPAGTVNAFGGSTAPAGWLFCSGGTISRTTFAGLFAVIGTTYGAGNGSTTFNLPDLRGRVIAGEDDMGGTAANRLTSGGSGVNGVSLGAAGGTQTHTLTSTEMPSHSHTGSATEPATTSFLRTVGVAGTTLEANHTVGRGTGSFVDYTNSSFPQHSHGLSINATGGSAAHNNTQPTIVLNYIIKA